MDIRFKEYKECEIDALVEFLTSDTWRYYGTPNPNPDRIREMNNDHYYLSEEAKTIWIILDDIKIGIIRAYELQDSTPVLEIRIHSNYKGKGIGTVAINWITDYIFNTFSHIDRIEGDTRQDNYGMRCVFHKCGYIKEAHHRKAWPCDEGIFDSIGYAITKDDWANKKVTPFEWNDFKC
jgi:RimJ/RimL family protein N-acetyltransferase